MATVEVSFSALPAHVRTARLVATAVARRAGLDERLLDEVRLAVGEACSRAVGQHQRHAPDSPVSLSLVDDKERFTVVVADAVPPEGVVAEAVFDDLDLDSLAAPTRGNAASETAPDLLPAGFGLAVITGLVDDVEVDSSGAGTTVTMSWPLANGRLA